MLTVSHGSRVNPVAVWFTISICGRFGIVRLSLFIFRMISVVVVLFAVFCPGKKILKCESNSESIEGDEEKF
jgi:hypothetical protein